MSFIFLGFNPDILLNVRSAEVVGPVPLVDFKYAGKFSSLYNLELWLFRDPTTATESVSYTIVLFWSWNKVWTVKITIRGDQLCNPSRIILKFWNERTCVEYCEIWNTDLGACRSCVCVLYVESANCKLQSLLIQISFQNAVISCCVNRRSIKCANQLRECVL